MTTFARAAALLATALIAAPLALVGCGDEGASQESDVKECTGASIDEGGRCRLPSGRFASASCCTGSAESASHSCNVVWVDDGLNGGLLEEGLGSQFDVDPEGFAQADSDSTTVDVDIDDGEARIGIGQHGWSDDDGDDVRPISEKPELNDETEFLSYTARAGEDDELFKVRIFTATQVGVVLHQESAKASPQVLARIDCRGLDQPDFEGEPVTAADHDCDVVWVDEELNGGLLEEGLGSLYDFDDEGFPQSDEDSTSVSVETSGDAVEVRVGQMRWSAEDGDDVKAIDEGPELNDDTGFQSFAVTPSGSEETYKVRIFTASRLGVVLFQESGSAEPQQLATIDCRGLDRPELY